MPKVKYTNQKGLHQTAGNGLVLSGSGLLGDPADSSSNVLDVTGSAGFQNLGYSHPRTTISAATDTYKWQSGYIFVITKNTAFDIDLPAASAADGNDDSLSGWNGLFVITGGLDGNVTITCDNGSDTIVSRSLGNDVEDSAGIICASNTITFVAGTCAAGDAVEIECIKDTGTAGGVVFLAKIMAST